MDLFVSGLGILACCLYFLGYWCGKVLTKGEMQKEITELETEVARLARLVHIHFPEATMPPKKIPTNQR